MVIYKFYNFNLDFFNNFPKSSNFYIPKVQNKPYLPNTFLDFSYTEIPDILKTGVNAQKAANNL